ncbi:amino acid permease [uncultured Ilyobacter sp.]|uniref:amino acid permease n=1 Tax=uncultured Ilyobacter sp. TaxID=544433 RepID=UPI0029F4EF3E|nr:amino acid permease [uncultured Ilyobacter sp.]
MEENNKLGFWSLVMLIFVPTFGFTNITNNAVYLGPAAIPSWFLIALFYFLPMAIMFAELADAHTNETGGIYTWIKSGLGNKWAFIGTWSYFIANLFYLQFVFSRIPVFASWALFGENRFNDSNTYMLPLIGILMCILLTWIATKGVEKFSKISDIGGKFTLGATVLFILFAIVGFFKGTPSASEVTIEKMIPEFNVTYFATFSWLLFAVAGAEVGGTYIDKVKNAKKTFPRGVIMATILIATSYVIGSATVFLVASPEALSDAGLKDASFVVYKVLAQNWGLNGKIIVQIYALILTITSIAAYTLWIESPIKAMFSEVPENIFPKLLTKTDEKGSLINALWIQALVVIILIAIPLLGLESIDGFFKLITDLSALSLVLPYLIIGFAYMNFRLKGLEGEYTFFKTKTAYMTASVIVILFSLAGFFGAGLDYVIGAETTGEAVKSILMTYGGPLILVIVGIILKDFNLKRAALAAQKNMKS